ncbi:general transcription factor 3C polypeptide 6 isoform X2 [Balaenoptera ricei]|uniref:general transcription factor 3C polypeptide 6 isoform X2 n=1 Tax=Balaenoptera ricei TaxID=2746895 RepID=UPI0028BDB39F|nr:general transcription factor 3C polypeptide 6 isoform X2 [Balaenoptera ricei]XP_061063302.1 general transcription factor 3C polypeptide 6 isoform X2 [Eubalaena glacialis]
MAAPAGGAHGSEAARRSGGMAAAAEEPSRGSSWFWWNYQELLIQTFSQNVKINARFWELILRSPFCKWTAMSLLESMKLPSCFSADTLGTCVIFEENVEHVDAEGNNKTVLKYKCHTMKKLSMTRTLLTEKKEGEENIGGVEWLQIKENDFSCRPNMICSFLHENEEDEVVAPDPDKSLELEEQEIQMKDNSNLSYEQEKPPNLDIEDSGPLIDIPSETEGSVFMETQETALEITPR